MRMEHTRSNHRRIPEAGPNVAWCNVARPASKSDSNPDLRMCRPRHNHAKPEQNRVL